MTQGSGCFCKARRHARFRVSEKRADTRRVIASSASASVGKTDAREKAAQRAP